LSLDPARYRERFCTKRFVGSKPTQKLPFGATPNSTDNLKAISAGNAAQITATNLAYIDDVRAARAGMSREGRGFELHRGFG